MTAHRPIPQHTDPAEGTGEPRLRRGPSRHGWRDSFTHWDHSPHQWSEEGPHLFQCKACGFRSSAVPTPPQN